MQVKRGDAPDEQRGNHDIGLGKQTRHDQGIHAFNSAGASRSRKIIGYEVGQDEDEEEAEGSYLTGVKTSRT